MEKIENNKPFPKLYTHCLRCGRRLKDLGARQRGYGSKCFGIMAASNSKKLFK